MIRRFEISGLFFVFKFFSGEDWGLRKTWRKITERSDIDNDGIVGCKVTRRKSLLIIAPWKQ